DLGSGTRDLGDELAAFARKPRLIALELHEAGDAHEVLLVEVSDTDELLADQLEFVLLGRLLSREPTDFFIALRDALTQLGTLAGACGSAGFVELLLAVDGGRHGKLMNARKQLLGECEIGGFFTLGQQPRLAGVGLVELRAHDAKRSAGYGVVEAY